MNSPRMLFISLLLTVATIATTHTVSMAQRSSGPGPDAGRPQARAVALPAIGTVDAPRSWLFGADSGANDGSSTLVRIDAVAGGSQVRGEVRVPVSGMGIVSAVLTDLAVLPDGRLFGVTFLSLILVNPQTGSGVLVGSIGFDQVNALASDKNGVLFAATETGEFLRLDTNTGRGTLIGSYGGGLVSSGDLAFDVDGTLYGTATDGGSSDILVRIEVATGRATRVGRIGFPDVFGLAFSPEGALYGSAHGARFDAPVLIRINTANGQGTAIGTIPNANGMFGLAANVRRSPVVGTLRVTGPENPNCNNVTTALWTFCQHQTGFHRPGGGVQGSDDTYAWDVNQVNDQDNGKPVFALAAGRVVRYAGVVSPQGNGSGAVLVEHSLNGAPCDPVPVNCWWSGYLHMGDIRVSEGQLVGAGTLLGFISHVSPDPIPNHLHLVVYEGANVVGGLRSIDVAFIPREITSLAAAILPGGRSVTVGTPATAFVSIVNAGSSPAFGVGMLLKTSIPAVFRFQTTNPATNGVTGTPNTPADIPAGGAQTFVVSITPTAVFGPVDVAFDFGGANTAPVTTLTGVNTLLLSASAGAVPDIVALAATINNDGIVNIPGTSGIGAFSVATVNVGAGASITVSADAGGASLPASMSLCQTNPTTGQCVSGIGSSVTTQVSSGGTPTFAIFVAGQDRIPFDPARFRVFVRFRDAAGVIRGSTGVAVRTQ